MITFKAKTASGEFIKSALTPFTFPAGEAHTKREEQRDLEPTEIAIIQPDANSIHDDLFQLAMWGNYISQENYATKGSTKRVLILPYFPGARADRGQPFGLEVYADFIGTLILDQIIIFDPHSEETVRQLKGSDVGGHITVVHSDELFDQVTMRAVLNQYDGIIAPDKGAVKRATAMADLAELPVFTATKKRDEGTGKLSGFTMEGLDPQKTYLIVDDICDGGGTFLGLAEASGLGPESIDLYVSHGVFSKNALLNLSEKFAYIYTTNSYAPSRNLDIDPVLVSVQPFKRFDVIRLLLSKVV